MRGPTTRCPAKYAGSSSAIRKWSRTRSSGSYNLAHGFSLVEYGLLESQFHWPKSRLTTVC